MSSSCLADVVVDASTLSRYACLCRLLVSCIVISYSSKRKISASVYNTTGLHPCPQVANASCGLDGYGVRRV